MRNFDNNDIEKIIDISLRADISDRHFEPRKTWFPSFLTNSQGKISFGETPQQISHYLLEVPEWFAVFVTKCTNIPGVRKMFNSKQPYSCVQKEISDSLEKIISNIEDRIFLLTFIEKYWNYYTEKENMIALVKRKSVDRKFSDYEISEHKKQVLEFSNSPEEVISLILGTNCSYFDAAIDVSPDNISIIKPGKFIIKEI